MNNKDLLKIAEYNGIDYNKLKLVEELNELSTAIIQSMTKGDDNTENVVEEFGDVEYRLAVMKNYYNAEAIAKRAEKKFNKSLGYIEKGKYAKV